MSQQAPALETRTSTPFWRDVRVLAVLGQAVFLLVVALIAGMLYANVTTTMTQLGMSGSYAFMSNEAGFQIGTALIPYDPSDPYWQAFQVGVINTIAVSVAGIALASILGIVVGVAQISQNWLIARLAQGFVAIFRNTPLLVQLVFLYEIYLNLPNVRNALELPGPIFLSQRGLYLTGPLPTETFLLWLVFVGAGIVGGTLVWRHLKQRQEDTGQPNRRYTWAGLIVVASGAVGTLLLNPAPFVLSVPELQGLNFQGGLRLTPEFAALLSGLVLYTGAFIAENVRAGIQGVPKGQTEAARAMGLSGGQMMRLVVLPQALRIIIPPTTNQYLNLTKNSSLAIAIGYPDLFNVTRTIFNQSGQSVQVIGLIMISYLSISLTTSLLMNLYNRSVRLVER